MLPHVIAFDPGPALPKPNCGIAWTIPAKDEVRATQITFVQLLQRLPEILGRRPLDVVIIEDYLINPNKPQTEAVPTAKTIGILQYAAMLWAPLGCPVVLQYNGVMAPTLGRMKAYGIESVAKGSHAKAAEAHLMHYLFRETKIQMEKAREL